MYVFQSRTIAAQAAFLKEQQQQHQSWTPEASEQGSMVDLQAEAQLDLDVCPEVWAGEVNLEPGSILLTGATGFLGTFLLGELLAQTRATIYCLVRCTQNEDGQRKVQQALEEAYLWRPEYASRILVVKGDLSKPRLGLSSEVFEHLARCIEAIYHNGALVNTVYPYSELKAANVSGTREILRLATTGGVKPLHYISTLSVFAHNQQIEGQLIREQETLDAHGDYMRGGYAQSKWVAEKLVTIARTRGLPVVIYRPGRITGHSVTGAWRTDDVLCRIIKGCLALGSIPEQSLSQRVEMTPVDYVSRAIIALSRKKFSLGQAFHLYNPAKATLAELVEGIHTFGYALQTLPYGQWMERVAALAQQTGGEDIRSLLLLFPEPKEEHGGNEKIFDDRHTLSALAGTAITCPPLDAHLLEVYLRFLVRIEFLMAPRSDTGLVEIVNG